MTSIRTDGAVAHVELADCGALSRHDAAAARALADALRDLGASREVKAIVLSSPGADFCPVDADAGALPVPREIWSRWYAEFATSSGLYQTLCYCPKVVVAAVQGDCAGAGSALALCCDLAVAAEDARFHSPFADIPEASFTLAALTMRLNRTKGWAIGEEPLDAATAEDWGLVNRVVPRAGLMAAARSMADAAARMPLDGLAITKLMRETWLDSQSVGREFDQARFYAAGMRDLASAGEGTR